MGLLYRNGCSLTVVPVVDSVHRVSRREWRVVNGKKGGGRLDGDRRLGWRDGSAMQ